MSNALIIFARKPQLGKVKTRLASQVGDERALDIYLRLLRHTKAVAQQIEADRYVFTTSEDADDFWQGFFHEEQHGNDLGERMSNAFSLLFSKRYQRVVIIGSDCPGLTTTIVEEAFSSLQLQELVIGPAEDGGYYLLGMRELHTSLFQNKDWSTDRVYQQTMDDIQHMGLNCAVLRTLTDIDEFKDVPTEWR